METNNVRKNRRKERIIKSLFCQKKLMHSNRMTKCIPKRIDQGTKEVANNASKFARFPARNVFLSASLRAVVVQYKETGSRKDRYRKRWGRPHGVCRTILKDTRRFSGRVCRQLRLPARRLSVPPKRVERRGGGRIGRRMARGSHPKLSVRFIINWAVGQKNYNKKNIESTIRIDSFFS